MFRTKLFLACAVASLFLLGPAKAATDDDYVFLLRARGNPYWVAMANGIEDTAKQNNIHATVYQISDDKAAEEQLNLCNDAIQRHPKFLSLSGATSAVSAQCLKNASEAGILVGDMRWEAKSVASSRSTAFSLDSPHQPVRLN